MHENVLLFVVAKVKATALWRGINNQYFIETVGIGG
jgi:hypothetical protein